MAIPSVAAGRPSCEIHPLAIGNRADPDEPLDDFATMLDIEVALIDEHTTPMGFRQLLRSNAAWFHLRRGL